MTEPIIKIQEVSKKYKKLTAVKELSLRINKGEIIGLVGPNGAGKTTLIKMIAKLLYPNSGNIFILNNENRFQNILYETKKLRSRGFLIDVPYFYKRIKIKKLLRLFGKLHGLSKSMINERISYLLNFFKLEDWKNKRVSQLSKGMKQKLGIIQALIQDPDIIVLDEPTTGLDPKSRIDVRALLNILKSEGKTIFISSHLLHDISEICDRIAVINHGRLIAFDSLENLEGKLKLSELLIQILETIEKERINYIIKKMHKELDEYVIQDESSKITAPSITYDYSKKTFKILFDGNKKSQAQILAILTNEFIDEFTIINFSHSKTSQLEKIYEELISEDDLKQLQQKIVLSNE